MLVKVIVIYGQNNFDNISNYINFLIVNEY